MKWSSHTELFKHARTSLNSCVLGDVMDDTGLSDQFLPPAIRPVQPGRVLVGTAMPVLEADVPFRTHERVSSGPLAKPFGLMFEALDDLGRDEVYICSGSSPSYALWGELMSTRAQSLGAAGAVVDGYSRDTRQLLEHALPVFSHGSYGCDQGIRGKVLDFRVPIRMRNVWIRPGDVVFGDIDGVVIVPAHAVDDIFHAAFEKVEGEDQVRDALLDGMSTVDAFAKFGIM